ncbi:MAG: cytochrome c oxidase subunit II [Chloroflexi bacterium]|nr:cytochrome c oxidase subunit II [Chloroflexota bacterium]
MRRHVIPYVVLWMALTVIGLAVVGVTDLEPVQGSEEAVVVDDAFRFLVVLSVPVFAFVVVALGYSVVTFRVPGAPTADAPAVRETRAIPLVWLIVTSALAILLIVNPGITGMAALGLGGFAERPADLVVKVEAEQWNWTVTYEGLGVTLTKATEVILPAGRRVRFDVTSTDIVHSLWIPAFRVKIDAVPGLTTSVSTTPTRTGSFEADPLYRLQCAELCGTGHARMVSRVTVLEPAAFERRMAELRQRAAAP